MIDSFISYQKRARSTAIYPSKDLTGALAYCALGLNGEAGEVADKIKRIIRGDHSTADESTVGEAIALELGDVLWYLSNLAAELGYSLGEIADMNLDKLEDRKANGTIKGNGDNR